MANLPSNTLENQLNSDQSDLDSSPTAYDDNSLPTSSDVQKDLALQKTEQQVQTQNSSNIRNEWYGPEANTAGTDEASAPPNQSLVGEALSTLQKPLNAIAGVAQYALGKGTSPDFFTSENNAISSGTEFGTILKQENVPRIVQMPLGFALDVMMDPVNWLTAGSESLVGGAAEGLVKGTMDEGLGKGLATAGQNVLGNLQGKVATGLSWLPGNAVGKIGQGLVDSAAAAGDTSTIGNALTSASDSYKNLLTSMATKSAANLASAAETTGTVIDNLGKGPLGMPNVADAISGAVGNTLRKIPAMSIGSWTLPSGSDLVDFFKYDPTSQMNAVKLMDQVKQIATDKNMVFVPSATAGTPGVVQDVSTLLKDGSPEDIESTLNTSVKNAVDDADSTVTTPFQVANTMDNAQALLESAGQDYSMDNLMKAYKVTKANTTGVDWYDNLVQDAKDATMGDILDKIGAGGLAKAMGIYDKVQDWQPMKNLLAANDGALKFFKIFHVADAPAMYVLQTAGNATTIAMQGGPVDFDLFSRIKSAMSFQQGNQNLNYIKNTFFNDANSWYDMLENNPNFFKMVFGTTPSTIANKVNVEASLIKQFGEGATLQNVTDILQKSFDDISQGLSSAAANIGSAAQAESEATPEELSGLEKARKTTAPESELSSVTRLKNQVGSLTGAEAPTGLTASELYNNNWMDQLKANIATKAAESKGLVANGAYGVANMLLNSMPKTYGDLDQAWRLGYADRLSNGGITAEQLQAISRSVPITAADVLPASAENAHLGQYVLTPQKAAEVASNGFVNYAAMPDFVKVMRALPVVGSPFLSFTYGMGSKTLNTLASNPEIFNKISYLISNISAAKTPAEKDALTAKYNSYLQSPTVIKLFGFLGGGVYTDARSFLPYLSLNMLQPSQKTYTNSMPADVISAVDASPFLKNPVGQTIFDYFIQPWLLSGSGQVAQNQFGEPLYPSYDASGQPIKVGLGEQAAYAARNAGEALVPGVAGFAGLANVTGAIPQGLTNAIPSYGFRQISNATQGEDTLGAETKEPAVTKTIRAVLTRIGFPVYNLDTTTSLPKLKQ